MIPIPPTAPLDPATLRAIARRLDVERERIEGLSRCHGDHLGQVMICMLTWIANDLRTEAIKTLSTAASSTGGGDER